MNLIKCVFFMLIPMNKTNDFNHCHTYPRSKTRLTEIAINYDHFLLRKYIHIFILNTSIYATRKTIIVDSYLVSLEFRIK